MKAGVLLSILGASLALCACSGSDSSAEQPISLTVPKATCGSNDKPETALQGQVPGSLRTVGGFKGFNCNLELVGQSRGDGASWSAATFADAAGHKCAYYGTSIEQANRTKVGSVTVDITNPAAPTPTTYLTTASMMDPWESLKTNKRRQLLSAVNSGAGGSRGGPEIDMYDISGDCRYPQLLSSTALGKAGGGGIVESVLGHEGDFAPDGLTYYGSDIYGAKYYAVDVTDTTKPKLLASFVNPLAHVGDRDPTVHGLSLSDDGNRAYFVSLAGLSQGANYATNPQIQNGLFIVDTSEIQARKPNPQFKVLGQVFWKDGSTAQHTIPVKIGGKPYIVFVDEGGAGNRNSAGWPVACKAGLPPFGFARIIDISDETNPKIVSRLMLETQDPKNCDKVLPDLAGITGFTYDSHYCAVDDRVDTTTLACGYFESGIRVFDIRDPARPKEIAYYNPPSVTTPSPGSQNMRTVANGRPDHCATPVNLDKATGTLWTACQDNGLLTLKFTNGVWPFR